MTVRTKIIMTVLPILLSSVLVVGITSNFSASSGVNNLARDFFGLKVRFLKTYTEGQWALLVENAKSQDQNFVSAAKLAVNLYAKSLLTTETEKVFALDTQGLLAQSSDDGAGLKEEEKFTLTQEEGKQIISEIQSKEGAFLNILTNGQSRVAKGFYFPSLNWYFVVSEKTETFYGSISEITLKTIVILIIAILIATLLLFILANSLTKPIREVVSGMKEIITSGDLTKAVPVQFNDETGTLAHTFNIMAGELDKAQRQIKNFAYQAVLSQKKEQRLKNVFQRYVPQEIIDGMVNRPEMALVGEERVLSILFSDIRSFTTISESMTPSDLVSSLNRYFGYMVDTIVNRKGIIDKYIGDAIMAFFGAPVKHSEDAYNSVLSAIEMSEKLKIFNEEQKKIGRVPFYIGIGINYGNVTVGNIGTDKKMDYTVIGDNVNLASRLEGLTKEYHTEIIISEFLHAEVADKVNWRLLDAVKVKGKTKGVRIFGVEGDIDSKKREAWNYHNEAMELYFERKFKEARALFHKAEPLIPGDENLVEMIDRCNEYASSPPSSDWDGAKVMKTK